ncbi:MAG TPA: ureidoglycolate lyase [Anaeromyxobacter sp.]|nr:ureidoglycolate lyase [Anaeromyxobacter sp.]
MRELRYRQLDPDAFAPYGSYAALIEPDSGPRPAPRIGALPIEFFRDVIQSGLGRDTTVSFGVCRVTRRPPVIDASEYHDGSCEALMPMDGDVLVHVAPAVPGDHFPAEQAEVFLVPRGTMVVLRPGVWHHGPFVLGRAERVSCLVALPERLYARDCQAVALPPEDQIRVLGEGL